MGPLRAFLQQQRRRVAYVSLVIATSTMLLILARGTPYLEACIRALELPYVYVLQQPDHLGNLGHSFVVRGYPGVAYEVASALDLGFALSRFFSLHFVARFLALPLAYLHWRMFARVAQAERRMLKLKSKKLSWKEYLLIYSPVAVKAGFFALCASVCVTLIAHDYLSLPSWLLYPVVFAFQLAYFTVGIHSALAYSSSIISTSFFYGFRAAPLPLPFFTTTFAMVLAMVQCLKWFCDVVITLPDSLFFARARQTMAVFEKIEARLLHVLNEVTVRVDTVADKVHSLMRRIITLLPSIKVKLFFDQGSTAAAATPTSSTTTITATEIDSHATTTTPLLKHLTPIKSQRPKTSVIPPATAPSSSSSSTTSSSRTRLSSFSSSSPMFLLASLLLSALLTFELLGDKPVGHTLRFGDQLHVGERRQYRCTVKDWLTSSPCKSLELVLQDDGTLRLYENKGGAGVEGARPLLWASTSLDPSLSLPSEDFTAQLDDRASLVVSLDSKVVYRTPRLLNGDRTSEPPELMLDGYLGGFYITAGPAESSAELLPTFASTW